MCVSFCLVLHLAVSEYGSQPVDSCWGTPTTTPGPFVFPAYDRRVGFFPLLLKSATYVLALFS